MLIFFSCTSVRHFLNTYTHICIYLYIYEDFTRSNENDTHFIITRIKKIQLQNTRSVFLSSRSTNQCIIYKQGSLYNQAVGINGAGSLVYHRRADLLWRNAVIPATFDSKRINPRTPRQ